MAELTRKEKLLRESKRAQAWLLMGDEKEYDRCHKAINDDLDLLDLDQVDAADRVTEHA